ncbi:regulatory protein, FmdB family [Desulfovibrio sp. X2]|uniref:FmdB family zinc ribbon protein n=1 Tax=Desulfovibrio sp. X2 TaxID=941449 RepID=UPI000358C44F|nr:zinc ribbon domain-containing protein [Desulfovibrio sp. X2]EPR37632.1 regulatory protein, FmdB family [Desulfovibrio sp. X2]
MPIYEYECPACGKVFEEWNKSFDDVESPCECGATAHRIVSNTAFVLKGSGWYVTDYCGKKASSSGTGGSSGETSGNASDGASGSGNGDGAKAAKEPASSSSSSSAGSAPAASAGTGAA